MRMMVVGWSLAPLGGQNCGVEDPFFELGCIGIDSQ